MNLAHYLFNLLSPLLFQNALLIVNAQNVLMDALKLLDEVAALLHDFASAASDSSCHMASEFELLDHLKGVIHKHETREVDNDVTHGRIV